MEYYRIKDILHVMRLLDHKNINNTLVYTQLVNSENDDYNSAIAKSIEEAQKLVETGFEYVCNFNDSSDSSENANDRYKLFSKTLRGLFVAGVVGFEPDPKWRCLPRNPSLFSRIKFSSEEPLERTRF